MTVSQDCSAFKSFVHFLEKHCPHGNCQCLPNGSLKTTCAIDSEQKLALQDLIRYNGMT